jgi:hypothetical protein
MSRLSRQCGILNISQPYRPPWPVTGIAFFYFWIKYAFGGKRCIDRISVHVYTNMDGSKKIPLLLTGKLVLQACEVLEIYMET